MKRFISMLIACCLAVTVLAVPAVEKPAAVFVECEALLPDAGERPAGWSVADLAGASGGKVLRAGASPWGAPECAVARVAVPRAGAYRVWIRYQVDAVASPSFYALFRDEGGEALAFHYCDWWQFLPTEKPYEKKTPWAGEKTGFLWESFDVVFERPVTASLSLGRYISGGGYAEVKADCLLLTADLLLNPATVKVADLPGLATPAPAKQPSAPRGFTPSKGLPAAAGAFAGLDNVNDRFFAGLINNASTFVDAARMVRMGFNRDHGITLSPKYGILTAAAVESYTGGPELAKQYPAPEGRFVNAAGEVGSAFSFHFPPVVESSAKQLEVNVKQYLDDPAANASVGWWRISVEDGGYLDYSPSAQAAFRAWLAAKHGTIETLNARWGTKYAAFAEIVPPAKYEDNRPGWLEFRDFSGNAYARAVGRQAAIIHRLDPQGRPCMGANSNLDMFSPYFSVFRPIDWEEFIHVGLAGEKYVAWDTYCADDQLACEAEFVNSIAEGRRLNVQEWSNHVVDPRIAARSYWSYVSKGVAGIHLFMFQEGTYHASYPKWALQNEDLSPKGKLIAYSDAAQEVHHLEPLLMRGRYTHAVKPVALYWSRIDLSLEKPHESLYGDALDSPFHIYRTLRGLGYPVRWITPKQIAAGELAQVAAVVLAGANHIPQAAAGKLEAWVKDGGVVIGDSWPGARDEYSQPQAVLAPVFGVRSPAKKAQTGSTIALQQSVQGYGEVTDAAVVRKDYFEKIGEIAQQPYATHPLAKAFGELMVSGIEPEPVECFAGAVVAMTHSGTPGFVLNDYGKGKALYSCLLLGTIYESSGTRYEWDTTHAGLSYGRILDAFLRYAGVQPSAVVSGLAPRVRAKLRVESPIVAADGNWVAGLTSMNDDAVGPFDLEIALPAGASGPYRSIFVATQGSRRLQPVAATVANGRMTLRVPRFDTHAAIVALQDAGPLVSLELKNVTRGTAGLAVIGAGQAFDIEAVVYNPSPRALVPGKLMLAIPAGWLQSKEQLAIRAIPPGGSARCAIRVKAPALAAPPMRILPLLARFDSGTVKSTPATEMVIWSQQ